MVQLCGRTLNLMAARRRGMIFPFVLIFLVLGALLLVPLLSYMTTGLRINRVYDDKTSVIYAADAGVEDAKWKIQWGKLAGYSPYEFNSPFSYTISEGAEIGENINKYPVDVIIKNVWIPKNYIDTPDLLDAKRIIDAAKLVVVGTTSETGIEVDDPQNPGQTIMVSQYKGKIVYTPGAEADTALTVDTIGVWLPSGYEYFGDPSQEHSGAPIQSTFEGLPSQFRSSPEQAPSNGNIMVVWNFSPGPIIHPFSHRERREQYLYYGIHVLFQASG